jgi:hypothetical protein
MGSFAPELKGIMAEFTVKRGRGQPFRRKSRGFAIENLRRKKRSLRVQAASLAFNQVIVSKQRSCRIIFLVHFTKGRVFANVPAKRQAKQQKKAPRFTARRMPNDVFT